MVDSGDLTTVVELPSRVDPLRTLLGMWAFPQMARAFLPLAAIGMIPGALVGGVVSKGSPSAVVVGALIGGLLALAGIQVGYWLLFRRLCRQAAPADARWWVTPSGVTATASGASSEVPWSTVVRLRMTDSSTSFLTTAPHTMQRTEAAVPPEARPRIEAWWQAALAPSSLAAAPAPAAPPVAVPTDPATQPIPSERIHLQATVTAEEWGRTAPTPRRQHVGFTVVLSALYFSTAVANFVPGLGLGVNPLALVPGLLICGLLLTFSSSQYQRWVQLRLGRTVHRQAQGVWGEGPFGWTIDTVGIEQVGSNGRRIQFAWSLVEPLEVDDVVIQVRPRDGVGTIALPVRVFSGDQLNRTLTWAGAGR